MYKHYRNYYWKKGKPCGVEETDAAATPISYKIIVDPYFKRFSIEKYQLARFDQVIYDSMLLDFRHLTLKDQIAWQREILTEEENLSVCLLRDQDDRAVLIETLTYDRNLCRSCIASTVHGVTVAIHRMYYRDQNDPFDGVILYDSEERPVMRKSYERDPKTGEFTVLIKEEWDMQNA